jgi:hypothetical protein
MEVFQDKTLSKLWFLLCIPAGFVPSYTSTCWSLITSLALVHFDWNGLDGHIVDMMCCVAAVIASFVKKHDFIPIQMLGTNFPT